MDLTKWPRLLVAGQPVTIEQANEILLRTDYWHLTGNDLPWLRTIARLAGIEYDEHDLPAWGAVRAFQHRIDALDLHYLGNSRIVSSWIGGPHGWCDWDGHIGAANYNIGKWPTAEAVTDDATVIAAAFPYLDLTVQLVVDEGQGRLCGQWRVQAGVATYDPAPTELVTPLADLTEREIIRRRTGPHGERGVTAERLREALAQVLKP